MSSLENDSSLFIGEAGFFLRDKYASKDNLNDETILQGLLNSINSPSFCMGYKGIFWLMAHLNNTELIGLDEDILFEFDDIIKNDVSNLNFKNYDFMHQDLGVVPFLIERKSEDQIAIVFEKLLKNKISVGNCYALPSVTESAPLSEINLSLSHGNASILALANISISENLHATELKKVVANYLDLYLPLIRKEKNSSFTPSFMKDGNPTRYSKRLAWCYGDLGVLYQLLWGSILVGNKTAENKLIECWLDLALYTEEDAHIGDACFCHGSIGIVYIFHKVYLLTNRNEFLKARDSWDEKTTSILKTHKNQFYSAEKWSDDNSLLEGSTAVDLVRMTISGKSNGNWDRCFLLS